MIGSAGVYFDTNAFIYLVEGTADRKATLARWVRRYRTEGRFVWTSELTIGECLIGTAGVRHAYITAYRRILFNERVVRLYPVSRPILEQAAALGAVHGLKLYDAIHVATALSAGCTVFLTNDRRIRDLPGLAILRPFPT